MNRIVKTGTISALILAAMTLSACNKTDSNQLENAFDVNKPSEDKSANVLDLQAYCPKLVLRAGTENYRKYAGGANKDTENASSQVTYQATITNVVRECKRENGMMSISVGAAGRIIAGPKGGPGSFNMPIRVAVTRGEEVLVSNLNQVVGVVPEGRSNNTFSYVDNNVVIPIPDKENIIVYVGFDEGPPKKKPSGS